MALCSRVGCRNLRSPGDLLFCLTCRVAWIRMCDTNSLNQYHNLVDIDKLLKAFQDGKLRLLHGS